MRADSVHKGLLKSGRGFTLIELLVVIAIIGLLSSIVMGSLAIARSKANDAKIRSDMHQIQVALQLYFDKNGTMPPNPTPGTAVAADIALQPLVTQGFISAIPSSPNTGYPYYYYDYGSGNTTGALVTSMLIAAPASTGYGGSCRPWSAGTNWCDQSSNTYFCICNPY